MFLLLNIWSWLVVVEEELVQALVEELADFEQVLVMQSLQEILIL
jgi:hypothetical protein